MQAVNGVGVGQYSGSTKVTTRALPPSPPRLECLMTAPTSLKLKRGDGRNPDMVRYTLEMEKEDGRWVMFLFVSLCLSLSVSCPFKCSLSLSLSLSLFLSLSLSHTHAHTHTHSLSLSQGAGWPSG